MLRLIRSPHLEEAATLELAVVHFADGWRILAGAGKWGRFPYRVDAEDAALRLGAQARDDGREVQILVQESYGRLRPLDPA